MSEGYQSEGACTRCIRSSPFASLTGFIIVLVGCGAFGGATIFARRYLLTLVDGKCSFPYVDYIVYGLLGATAIFALLAYVLCAFSSGRNSKRFFESSSKATCGRCCNMTLILCLFVAFLLWSGIACLMTYPLISSVLLVEREYQTVQISPLKLDREKRSFPRRQEFDVLPTGGDGVESGTTSNEHLLPPLKNLTQDLANETVMVERKDEEKALLLNSRQVTMPGNEKLGNLFACKMDELDLSYYGLYDTKGRPICITNTLLHRHIRNIHICTSIAVAGVFLVLLGYLQIAVCTAVNFSRMQEPRYFEVSEPMPRST